jgi:SAM-dependent methyltransferase
MLSFILAVFAMLATDPSSASMYKTYASYYDRFYQTKDYEKETCFLDKIFSQNQIKTVLDVGCGTGSHLSKLTQYGYDGEGIDLNAEIEPRIPFFQEPHCCCSMKTYLTKRCSVNPWA